MLVDAVRILASPAGYQNDYISNGGFHHDELALNLDDVLDAAIAQCGLTAIQIAALKQLDRKLDAMSGESNAALWTEEGIESAAEWREVRDLAARSLAALRTG